ncbi:MAG: hypothetical protein ABI647_06550 [Gemmatimonadota bacterium]
MRNALSAALAMMLVACGRDRSSGGTEANLSSDGRLQVSATARVDNQNGMTTISARITNSSDGAVTIRVRCTPIEVERNDSGTWLRIEDLRLCAPPDRTNLPPRTTVDIDDIRQLSAGQYRAVIELIDGGQSVSGPFSVPSH